MRAERITIAGKTIELCQVNGPPAGARLHAALSLACWVAVIACGRMLAYV